MELAEAINQVKGHLLRRRVFPWMRNWCAFGPITLDGDRVPWLPTLFVGDLVFGNVLEDGNKATFSVNKAGHLQRFRNLQVGFSVATPETEAYDVQVEKLPELGNDEKFCSLYARSLYGMLNGSPLSVALQVHFLSMCMGFSNFFFLEDAVVQRLLGELEEKSFLNAMKDACVRASQLVAVEPKELWISDDETPTPGGSFFGE